MDVKVETVLNVCVLSWPLDVYTELAGQVVVYSVVTSVTVE